QRGRVGPHDSHEQPSSGAGDRVRRQSAWSCRPRVARRELSSPSRPGARERSGPGASSNPTAFVNCVEIDQPAGVSTPLAIWFVEHDRLYWRRIMATAAADNAKITRDTLIQKLNKESS